jgi:ankyrin repeat protein
MKIGISAPRYEAMALLYPRSTKLQSHLCEYFIIVVRLCHHLLRYTQKSILGKLAASLSDSDMMTYQSDLDSCASHIKEEVFFLSSQKIEEEARANRIFRGASSKLAKSDSYRLMLKAKLQALDILSTFDHEREWKRIRKAGNTTLINQAKYEDWKDETKSSMLTFSGKLGSGKSVLLANIVDDLYLSAQSNAVAYFFCRYDLPNSLKARTIIGSLARQLLHHLPDFKGAKEHLQYLSKAMDCERILNMLRDMLPPAFEAYFVLDGLDECDETERRNTLLELQRAQQAFTLRICISLRPEPNNTLALHREEFVTGSVITISDDNPDIVNFIDAELESCIMSGRLSIGDPTLILEIQDALLRGSQGMFLWVALQIKSLSTMKTDNDIRLALADLPKDLPDTYSRVLQKSDELDHQRRILQLVAVAQRPLTTEELREALSVVPGNDVWNQAMLINDIYSTLACCGSLIVIDEEDLTVQFTHHSVSQFLLNKHTDSSISTGKFTMEGCHRQMADIIVTYLNYGIFDSRLSTKVVPQIPARSAPSAIIRSALDSSSTVTSLALRLLKSRRQHDFDIGKTLSEARRLVKFASADDFHFHAYAKSFFFKHISSIPAQERHEQLRKVLRDGIVDANAANEDGMTLLIYAINNGYLGLVRMLLEMDKIDVNLPDTKDGRTPLGWAAEQGDPTAVSLLLDTGTALPNLRDESCGCTPLIWAARREHEEVVRLLLENNDVEPDLKDTICGRTALSWAAELGNDSVVKLLLETGEVDINTKSSPGRSRLMYRQNGLRTPVSFAAQHGKESVVKLLLKNTDLDPDSQDQRRRTPLFWAAFSGHTQVVKLLLETGKVNPNMEDRSGNTPLSVASLHGQESVVRLLIDTEKVDPSNYDAKSAARMNGHMTVVQLLCDAEAMKKQLRSK